MAAYNGEKYVAQQLESLLRQTRLDFVVHIHDDHSTDKTWEIIKSYESRNPGKIIVFQNPHNSGGAQHNFINMMINVKDEYVMLCDQDDVWMPDKVEKTIKKIRDLETLYGKDTPILVHTDLTVVNENLGVISPSYRRAMKVGYYRIKLRHLIIQNIVTGCSAAYNRSLASLMMAAPDYMVMHDWWLGLIAAAFGRIGYLNEPSLLYRQHAANQMGAHDVRTLGYKLKKLTHGNDVRQIISRTYRQAAAFLRMYWPLLSTEQITLLTAYVQIPQEHKLMRCMWIIRLGVLKHGISRKIAHFLFV
jgi:glycosyltransferase involved in cell wall biosynthesis